MQALSRTSDDLCEHDMVKDVQAKSRTYDLYGACQNGRLQKKPNMNGNFDGVSSSKSIFDNGTVTDGKTKSLADGYEKCNMMMNEPACNKEAAQMDENKLAIEEELMMKKNQTQYSAKVEYIAAAAAPKQALWIKKHGRYKQNNVKFHVIREAEKKCDVQLIHCRSEEQMADIRTKASTGNKIRD
ncbi:hypothetical protein LWI28_014102 [Acer negundo]|uniref:Uncharacterized protein n=1 Tax=Acer negundo TaxID=4023 RepID=A0AAD5P5A3_ACENE|nr:hypothetical protein LWI28_014102 [Acer negundo]